MKYRKKPVVINAAQFRNATQFRSDAAGRAVVADVLPGTITYTEDGTMLIRTLEGVMEAQSGDWIIRGVKGELYPCKPDVFAATYELVEDESDEEPVCPGERCQMCTGEYCAQCAAYFYECLCQHDGLQRHRGAEPE